MLKPGRHPCEGREAAQQQSSANQEHQGQADFGNDKRCARRRWRALLERAAAFFVQ